MTNLVIRSRNELDLAYELLQLAEDRGYDEKAKEYKKMIRAYNKRPVDDRRVVSQDDYGSVTILLPLPESIDNLDDAKEWFEYNEYMTCRPSMYDCTGQLFTSWYKLFQRNGRYWAYHCVSIDC